MTDSVRHRCPSTRLSGAHCTLEAGHMGAHLEIADNGVTGWPQVPIWQPFGTQGQEAGRE